MSRQLNQQHDEIKRRNHEQRMATMAEAERLRALRSAKRQ